MTASLHHVDPPLDAQPAAGPAPVPSAVARDPGRAVREFEGVCMKHRVACGAPENLAPFLRALGENKLLAMNFWSAFARLGEPKHGALTHDEILAAIARAVTGQSIEDGNESQRPDIDRLARLLAGEDVALNPALPPAVPEPPAEQPAVLAPLEEHKEHHRNEQHVAEPALPSLAPNAATSRLVLLPDPPRSLGAAIAAAPELAERSAQAQVPETASPAQPSRLHMESHDRTEEEPRLTIPLAAYADRAGQSSAARRTGIAFVLLILLGSTSFLAMRNQDVVRQSAVTFWQNSRSLLHLGTSSPPQAPAITSSAVGPANDSVAEITPASAPPAETEPPPAPTTAAQGRGTPTPALTRRNINTQEDAADAGLVQVSGAEMHDHLISSRFPIVPDAASADAVSGVVTLEAVVTDRGTVEHIHAISGPEALRQPAIDAVSGWRYRPYLVDGAPTDVRTTIRVDFSGND